MTSTDHDSILSQLEESRRQFLALVNDVRPDLHRYCARMTGSIADGEDVVQDTLAYMLSTEFKKHDHESGKMVTVFPPHVMFYAPHMKNSDIGARPEHLGSQSQPFILNEGKPYALIIVVPKEKQ